MSDNPKYFWKGFRKGLAQGAMFGSIFFGLGTYVLLFQHRWLMAVCVFLIGCGTSYLGMKVWIQERNKPTEPKELIEAHEWECKTCNYVLRLEIGPLCCEGGICSDCHGPVEYHGIKQGVPKSSLGRTPLPSHDTLAPCPFCGKQPYRDPNYQAGGSVWCIDVSCPIGHRGFSEIEWNTRAPCPQKVSRSSPWRCVMCEKGNPGEASKCVHCGNPYSNSSLCPKEDEGGTSEISRDCWDIWKPDPSSDIEKVQGPMELLPCPFCGAPAEHDSRRWSGRRRGMNPGPGVDGHAIYCSGECPVPSVGGVFLFDTYEEARAWWNKRSNITGATGKNLSLPASFYATFLPSLRAIAAKYGYALAIHGSMARDFDLIALPWQEWADDHLAMATEMRDELGGWFHSPYPQFESLVKDGAASQKPHGRIAYSIHLTEHGMNGPYVDISVAPSLPERVSSPEEEEKKKDL